MTDLSLDAVGAAGRLIVDGPWAQEPTFGPWLAALRSARVELSSEPDGALVGAALLERLHRGEPRPLPELRPSPALQLDGLAADRAAWRRAVRREPRRSADQAGCIAVNAAWRPAASSACRRA